jgi:hypothetical protein
MHVQENGNCRARRKEKIDGAKVKRRVLAFAPVSPTVNKSSPIVNTPTRDERRLRLMRKGKRERGQGER